MTEEKKKGIFSMLFGKKNACCCDVKIEEITEEEEKAPGDKSKAQPAPSSCDIGPGASR